MDQKPPVVPRATCRGPWGEEHHKEAPPQHHHMLEYSVCEKRTLSAGYDLSRAGVDSPLIQPGTAVGWGTRGSSEPPLQTCRSATASPHLALSHASPPLLRGATSLNCSLEELSARREDLEKKRKMVQNERLQDQETQRREQVRLEEILNMCAEYERQVQWEHEQQHRVPRVAGGQGGGANAVATPWQQRVAMANPPKSLESWEKSSEECPHSPSDSPSPGSSSDNSGSSFSPPFHQAAPPNTPPVTIGNQSVHQNRIKTNGSLPRDKQRPLHSPPTDALSQRGTGAATDVCHMSSSTPSPDTDLLFGFNFDTSPFRHSIPHTTSSLPRHFGHERGEGEGGREEGTEAHHCHNGIISSATSPPTSPTYPQSPRTRIRTNAASKASPSSPPPPRGRRGVARCEVEDLGAGGSAAEAEDGQQHHVSRAALLLLCSSQGRPVGGTLPRSHAVPCSREGGKGVGGEGTASALLAADGIRNAEAKDGATERLSLEGEGEAEELKRERGKLLVALAAIKRKMNDIERQQEEALRELEMEQALLEGELNAVMGKVVEEESRAEELAQELAFHERKARDERECTLRQLSDCQRRVEEAQSATQRLENGLLSNKDPDKVELLREQLKHQQETLEAERKAYEDLEFHQLEREAWWEAGREEMSREVSEVSVRARGRRHRMEQLKGAREEARGAAEGEATRIRTQRDMLLGRLYQGRQRLKVVERRLSDLSRMGINVASWDCSPEGSSDPDESPPLSSAETTSSVGIHALPHGQDRLPPTALSTSNLEMLNGAQGCVQRKQSQDDLDRISRVTSGAPMDVSSGGSLGRRTIESLKTIERNRQIHLAQQGSQVIEEERRRVEELKRRAQDEVRAKWEEGRLRVHAGGSSHGNNADAVGAAKDMATAQQLSCNGSAARIATQGTVVGDIRAVNSESLNSIGSEGEDSSITESSDAPAESTTSSEEAGVKGRHGQRLMTSHGGRCLPTDAPKMSASTAASSEQTHASVNSRTDVFPEAGGMQKEAQQLDQPMCSRGEGVRPISDVSSEGEEGTRVRRRAASTGRLASVQHQRPLTRYLPIRGQQLDLRSHMEWAGHQPDLCPHVTLSALACRGHLLKAPASVSASVIRRASSSSFGGSGGRGGVLLSGLRGGGWARRWFVFDRSARCFSYYTDSSEKKSRCIVDFEAIEDVYVDHLNSVKSPSPRLTFCVKTRERAFHLVAPSAEAMRIWVDVIFTGAEGYTGFEYVT